ncbi:MaoC family dehydratase [Paraburkholderia phenoliruptrix]|uniref:MaoC family dehydratase n=1 Tax=Paraburkholderia phenoliruptrix TaxID=252970 RepID=UPI00320B8897
MSTASTRSIEHVIHKENLSDFPVSSGYDKLRFLKPVALGDTITVIYEVIRIDKKKGRGIAENEVFNQRDELVPVGERVMRWAKKLKGE